MNTYKCTLNDGRVIFCSSPEELHALGEPYNSFFNYKFENGVIYASKNGMILIVGSYIIDNNHE